MAFPPPSTYTPFLRRFGNEREREMRETRELYAWVKAHHDAITESPVSISAHTYGLIDHLPEAVLNPFVDALYALTSGETQIWDLPPPAFERMNLQEFVEYRNLLHTKRHFFANKAEQLALLQEGLTRLIAGMAYELPELSDPTPFSIPLIHAFANPRGLIQQIFGTVGEYYDQGLFRETARQMYRNLCMASGRDPDDAASKRQLIQPEDSTVPFEALADTYLYRTPFHSIFDVFVPLRLTHEERFNHWHIVGGSGSGKTTLLEGLIRHDLASDDPPTIVLLDPHSDLVRKLVRSELGLDDRLILINPRDTKFPVALNPLAVNRERLATYDEATREQVTAGVIQTFGYLFSGLTNLTLTGKQDVFFRYVTRLLLSLPDTMGRNATILDMLKLMADPVPYGAAIAALPDIQREFFTRDFMGKTFEGTKEQIRYRLQAIIESPTMARLFTAPETKVDLFTEMNRGAVILVDTAKDFLKEGSAVFGKLMISLILQAVLERAAIAETDRKPTFLIVDEAATYFSSNIDDLLTEARKFKCGLVLAHQYMDQASSSLRASLAANTGIKFVSGVSAADARAIAPEMRTTPDFILNQPQYHFAAHIRNVTPSAVSIPIHPADDARPLSSEEFEQLIARNRARVSLATAEKPNGSDQEMDIADATIEQTDEDISPDW